MIYITGDTHIPHDISKLNMTNFPEQKNMTRNDYVIVLGDFGLYWNKDKTFEHWNKWLQNKNFTLLWIDGNHENFDWINSMPVTEWHGGKVHKNGNIIHLMRGNCFEIEGKHFLALGGATSSDKEQRSIGISWWKEEEWNYKEQEFLFDNLEKTFSSGIKIDYILSHTCPQNLIMPMFHLSFDEIMNDSTSKILQEVWYKVNLNIKGWYFGHWHIDKDYNKFHCIYDKILKI